MTATRWVGEEEEARNRAHGDVFPDDTIEDLRRIAGQTGLKSKLPF